MKAQIAGFYILFFQHIKQPSFRGGFCYLDRTKLPISSCFWLTVISIFSHLTLGPRGNVPRISWQVRCFKYGLEAPYDKEYKWIFLQYNTCYIYTPEVVAHWCSGFVFLIRVSIQTVEVVFWFTVSHIHIKVTCPVNHNTNSPSLSGHKHIIHRNNAPLQQEKQKKPHTLKDNTCAAVIKQNIHLEIISIHSVMSKDPM